jgi:hypothetical protein
MVQVKMTTFQQSLACQLIDLEFIVLNDDHQEHDISPAPVGENTDHSVVVIALIVTFLVLIIGLAIFFVYKKRK